MDSRWTGLTFGCALLFFAAQGEAATDAWDGLNRVQSTRFDAVYLLPGADFRPYTKLMIDTAEVAFHKNWMRDYNRSTNDLSRRVSERDLKRAADDVRKRFDEIIRKSFMDAGYALVAAPAPDVLRLSTAVINVEVAAPDVNAFTRSYSLYTGEATVVLEARDSTTGALLGRAVDRREAGMMNNPGRRTKATNRTDFSILFRNWAKSAVDGFSRLKAMSPAVAPPPG
jgi:hypothetical protein